MNDAAAKPEINLEDCTGCGDCVTVCPSEAINVIENKVRISPDIECSYCDACEEACPIGAIAWPYEVVFEDARQAS